MHQACRLLLARNDPRLHDRLEMPCLDYSIRCNSLLTKEIRQAFGLGILPDQARNVNRGAKLAQVASNIGRPAGVAGLALDLDYGDGSLGRDTGDFAPDKLVEHDIPDNQQPPLARLLKKMLYSI